MAAVDIHNRDVGAIVRSIVMPTLEVGGDMRDVLVLLESVCAGVMTLVVRPGGDNVVLDLFMDGLRERMANVRIGGIEPKGSA